jgi:hypothetical protein
MKRKRLLRLLLALARYCHDLEQATLLDERAAADVAKASGEMSKRWPMWREDLERIEGNNPGLDTVKKKK